MRPIYGLGEIREVVEMIRHRSLDVRSVTLALDARGCASGGPSEAASCVEALVEEHGRRLREAVERVKGELGVPVTTVRIALTPVEHLAAAAPEGRRAEAVVEAARAADRAAERAGVDYVGGWGLHAEAAVGPAAAAVAEALPTVLSETRRVMGFFSVGSTLHGLSFDATRLYVETLLRSVEEASSPLPGAKLVAVVNPAPDIPFLPAAHHGPGMPPAVLHVAISGPGAVAAALEGLPRGASVEQLYESLKRVGFKAARLGQLVLDRVAAETGYAAGAVDLSLAPTPEPGDSIAAVLEAMGARFGAPGSVAALALLVDALKKGGGMAVCCHGGYSGAMIPVMEDSGIAKAVAEGLATMYKLIAMTGVCSTGLDMAPVPGDTPPETLTGLALDTLALGVAQGKLLGVRLVPVPGAEPGDVVELGGLLGKAPVMDPGPAAPGGFTGRRGRMPPPLRRLLAS
ncbi:MAG: DUF711 family protein [Crenarchaeota archaeon]|nr:DUF711 family protein [Thermoproteota archaeon]